MVVIILHGTLGLKVSKEHMCEQLSTIICILTTFKNDICIYVAKILKLNTVPKET